MSVCLVGSSVQFWLWSKVEHLHHIVVVNVKEPSLSLSYKQVHTYTHTQLLILITENHYTINSSAICVKLCVSLRRITNYAGYVKIRFSYFLQTDTESKNSVYQKPNPLIQTDPTRKHPTQLHLLQVSSIQKVDNTLSASSCKSDPTSYHDPVPVIYN